MLLVHGHVPGVLLEVDARRLPRQRLDPVGLLAALGVLAVRGQVAEGADRVSPGVRLGRAAVGSLGPSGLDELPQQRGLVLGGLRERTASRRIARRVQDEIWLLVIVIGRSAGNRSRDLLAC